LALPRLRHLGAEAPPQVARGGVRQLRGPGRDLGERREQLGAAPGAQRYPAGVDGDQGTEAVPFGSAAGQVPAVLMVLMAAALLVTHVTTVGTLSLPLWARCPDARALP